MGSLKETNKRRIELCCYLWEKIQKGTAWYVDTTRGEGYESEVPYADAYEEWESDSHVAFCREQIRRAMRSLKLTHFHLWEKLWLLGWENPASEGKELAARWEREERVQDGVMHELKEQALYKVASSIMEDYPDLELEITSQPEDIPASSGRESQKRTTEHTDRLIVRELESLEKRRDFETRKEAIKELSRQSLQDYRRQWSPHRIRWAIKRVNKMGGNGEAA